MIAKINAILEGIYLSVREVETGTPSLLAGNAGCSLFKWQYMRYRDGQAGNEDFFNEVQLLAEQAIGMDYLPFCGGKSGINWFFNYLYVQNVLDKESWELQSEDNSALAETALKMMAIGNYDFLHGAIGIAYQLLYAGFGNERYYKQLIDDLLALSETSSHKKMPPFYDFQAGGPKVEEINIGLAHGLPSMLKFLLVCYQKKIEKKTVKEFAGRIIDYLLEHINKDTSGNYFPSIVFETKETNPYSRLGWCYGDLGIAFILYQAGIIFNNQAVTHTALHILQQSTLRRDVAQTGVYDAGICHGSAGIAHIYNKLWHKTQNAVFKDACNFWIAKTISYAVFEGPHVYYEKYDTPRWVYEKEIALLEGTVGVGLVLLSYVTGDCSWDYCLLLND